MGVYRYENLLFYSFMQLVLGDLKNMISNYDENGLSVRMHGNARKRLHNQTKTEEVK